MLFKKKQDKSKPLSPKAAAQDFIQQASQFEQSRIEMIKKSNKLAWTISGVAVVTALISVFAVAMITPLKTVEPFVLKVDNSTGAVDIVTTLKTKQLTYGEVTDKYWLSQYIKYRESYDWWTVQDYYNATMLLSAPAEQNIISQLFQSPAAPYKVFKDQFRVDVRILSVSWVGKTAQVRFEKIVKPLAQGNPQPPRIQRLIATIGYQYLNAPQSEADRLINPLGLQVQAYRVDPEGQ